MSKQEGEKQKKVMPDSESEPIVVVVAANGASDDDAGERVFEAPVPTMCQCFDPLTLQKNYIPIIPSLLEKPVDRKKHKGTNIPKFLLKVFFNNLPEFPSKEHMDRLLDFIKRPQKSKTRFHLVELFGSGENQREKLENELNRKVLKRLLVRNYDNILINKHIRNKRLYLLFCKKMLLRLNRPELIDRLEI